MDLKTYLRGKIPDFAWEQVQGAFDLVGNIAVIQIPDGLVPYEKMIAEGVLAVQKQVKTVVKRTGMHEGEFRTQKLSYLAGEDTKETMVIENGIRLLLDVEQVYYSVRSSTERARIAALVKPHERVLVMFSGCGPFALTILHLQPNCHVTAVELNPIGTAYHEKSTVLNKSIARRMEGYDALREKKESTPYLLNLIGQHMEVVTGDVREVVPTLGKFSRIVMPLPKTAEDFLDVAVHAAQTGTIIHFYTFGMQADFPKIRERLEKKMASLGKKGDVQDMVLCGHYAPYVFRICVDILIRTSDRT